MERDKDIRVQQSLKAVRAGGYTVYMRNLYINCIYTYHEDDCHGNIGL